MPPPNYYRLLGVARTAKTPEIRKAYRALVLQFHPDRNPGNQAAEEQFKAINDAYRNLSDPKLRLKYDLLTANEEMPRVAYSAPSQAAAAQTRPAPVPEAPRPAPPRPKEKGLRTYLDYQTELNELDPWDGVLGIVFGCSATLVAHAYLRPEDRRPEFVVMFLWALLPFLVGPPGFFMGRKLQAALEDSLDLEDTGSWWMISLVKTLPLLFALALCCGVLVSSQFFRAGVFTWRIVPAAISAGLAAIGGSGMGRAFVIVSTSTAGKAFGASVGAVVGFVGGLVLGLVLALLSAGRGFDIMFFEGFFSAGVGGAIGGMVASFIGSYREFKQDDF